MLKSLLTNVFAFSFSRIGSRRRQLRSHVPEQLEARILLSTRTWDGGAILNDNWSDRDNWEGNVAPVNGDDLVFPAGIGVLDRRTNNDLAFKTFNGIRFEAGDFKLSGNSITLTGGITMLKDLATNKIELDITFTATTHGINVAPNSRLELNGRLKSFVGTGQFSKLGLGVLSFGGEFPNTMSQPILVHQGDLLLQKSTGATAINGPLTIGAGPQAAEAGGARVIVDQFVPFSTAPNAIAGSPPVRLNVTGLNGIGILQNNVATLRLGPLTLQGGRIQGGGKLQLTGDVSVLDSPQQSRLDIAAIDLGSSQRKFKIGSGAILRVTSDIKNFTDFNSTPQGFVLDEVVNDGGGKMILFPISGNTYKGRTQVRAGFLEIDAAVSGRTVIPGDVTIGSTVSTVSQLISLGQNLIADTATIQVVTNGRYRQDGLNEAIGRLEISDGGVAEVRSGAAGLFRVIGGTTVSQGGVFLAVNRGNALFEGDVRVLGGTITADQGNITFKRKLILNKGRADSFPNPVDDTIGILFFENSIETQSAVDPSVIAGRIRFKASPGFVAAHILRVFDGTAANDLVIDATIEQGSSTNKITKVGLGTLVFNGNKTSTNTLEQTGGKMFINGQQLDTDVVVPPAGSGLLGGTGAVHTITMNSNILAPGQSPGVLSTPFGVTTMAPGSKLQIELNGLTPGTQHDQLAVGDFNLGVLTTASFPTLEVFVNFATLLNQTFEIVDVQNDSGTRGKFKDTAGNILNQGSTFIAGGVAFQISYVGGDGNDVTIKRVSTPPAFQNRVLTPVINEGGFVTLSGLITEPDAGDTFFLDVNWGDGTTETFTFAPGSPRQVSVAHRYLDDAPSGTARDAYNVHLVWRDEHGGSNTADLRAIVRNADPQVSDLAFDTPPVRGQDANLRGRILDPSPLDPIRLRINWGDGSAIEVIDLPAGTSQFQLTHRFARAGWHLAQIQGFDDDGGRSRVARLRIRVGRS